MKIKMILTALLLCSSAFSSYAQDAQYIPTARPTIQPCALKDAEDPAIAAAAKAVATADNATKIKIATDLGNTCNKQSTPILIGLLQDPDTEVKIAAIEALGHLGDQEAVEALVDLRSEPNWKLRYHLGPVLASIPLYKARYNAMNFIASTAEVKLDADDIRARCQTILALHQLTDVSFSRKSLRFLFGYLDNKDPQIHQVAVDTIHEMVKTRNFKFEIVGELKQALNPSVRKICAYWIGELKIERGRDQLMEVIANDADAEVKKVAQEALKKLGKAEN